MYIISLEREFINFMRHFSDKDIVKELTTYGKEETGSEKLSDSFPFVMLKIDFSDVLRDTEIKDALEGLGSNDEGVDAFWVNKDEKVMYFAQFKSTDSKKIEEKIIDKKDLSYLCGLPKKLEEINFINSHSNERIKEIADDYNKNKDDYEIKFLFYFMGKIPQERITSYYKEYENLEIFSMEEIKEKWLEYQTKNSDTKPEECTVTLADKTVDIKKIQSSPEALISTISGVELYNLFNENKNSIFTKNVRFYLGKKDKINKGVIQTALEHPNRFFYYNGGLTITCKGYKFNEDKNKLRLEFPQVINGAQTIRSIVEAYKNKKVAIGKSKADDHFEKLKVLLRVIRTYEEENSDIAKYIPKYNNSQNKVLERDFRANDKVQQEIQKKLAEEGYFYEIKRGERDWLKLSTKNKHEVLEKTKTDFRFFDKNISIDIMAQILQAWGGSPSVNEMQVDKILANEEVYTNLFGKKFTEITDYKIKEMIFAFNLYSFIVKQRSKNQKLKKLLVSKNNSDLKKMQGLLSEIGFVEETLKDSFKGKSNIEEVDKSAIEAIINNYEPLARGKWFILASIKYILDEIDRLEGKGYNKFLIKGDFNGDLFSPWIGTLALEIKKLLKKEQEKDTTLSYDNIFKNAHTFKNLSEKMKEEHYEGKRLSERFKLS